MRFLGYEFVVRKIRIDQGYPEPRPWHEPNPDDDSEPTEINNNQVWVARNGRAVKIKDMSNAHVRNALGLIVRKLHENKVAYLGKLTGRVNFADLMHNLVDNEKAFLDEKGQINITNTARVPPWS